MNAPVSATELLEVLARSNLVAPHYLPKLRVQIPGAGEPGHDAKTFAVALIHKGVLSPFQAKRLLTGSSTGFYIDKYRLLDVLGEGGMGKVYLAEQTTMKRAVALKIVQLNASSDDSTMMRFSREARAVAKLRHPNVTQAFDFDQYRDYQYIAMELVEGLTLQELVQRVGPIPYAQACDYVCQACMGLEHAQRAGLVHRDVKPGNLMVERTGILKILDLGLVGFQTDRGDSLTLLGQNPILGTADYVSPEQALDSHGVDIRGDLYSLGCVLYFLLTGSPPFAGKTAAQKLLAHQRDEPKPMSNFVADVPQEVADVVRRMMAKDPRDRIQTPLEVKKALFRFSKRIDPPFDPSMLRHPRSVVDRLVHYGAEAPASTTRLGAAGESTHIDRPVDPSVVELDLGAARDIDTGLASGARSTRRLAQAAGAPSTRRASPQTVTKSASGASPTARKSFDRPITPTTLSVEEKEKPKVNRSLLLIGSGCCLVGLVAALVALSFSGRPETQAQEPSDTPPSEQRTDAPAVAPTIQVSAEQNRRAIATAFSQIANGGEVRIKAKPGGWLIDRLVVNGEQLPNRGRFAVVGESEVIWLKGSDAPVLRITRADSFQLQKVTIDGRGRRGPLIEIEGAAAGVTLRDVVLKNFRGEGIRFIGAEGQPEQPIRLVNVRVEKGGIKEPGTAIAFRSRNENDRTRHVRVQGCQFLHNGAGAVLVGQPVEDVSITSSVFNGGPYGARFAATPYLANLTEEQPIREWLVSGWWDNDNVPSFDPAAPPAATGRELTRIRADDVDGTIDFAKALGEASNRTALAYARVHSESAGRRGLYVGAEDNVTIWVNGKKVFAKTAEREHVPLELNAEANLRKGDNHVWVKVVNGRPPSQLRVLVAPQQMQPLSEPDWHNFTMDDCTLENHDKALFFDEAPSAGSKIVLRNLLLSKNRHYPILVRKSARRLIPGTIVTANNDDVNPKPERAEHDDSREYSLIALHGG